MLRYASTSSNEELFEKLSSSLVNIGRRFIKKANGYIKPRLIGVWLKSVIKKCLVTKWIFYFLYNRTMYVKFNNILQRPKHVSKGTMEGVIISRLLYSLHTSQLKYITFIAIN